MFALGALRKRAHAGKPSISVSTKSALHLPARIATPTSFLRQFKTLLTVPELPVASDVAVPRDIAYFIEFLKPKLGEHHAEFLTALFAALNDRTGLSTLDQFPEWCNQPPVPFDTRWR